MWGKEGERTIKICLLPPTRDLGFFPFYANHADWTKNRTLFLPVLLTRGWKGRDNDDDVGKRIFFWA